MSYDPEMKEIIDAFVFEGYERLEEAENELPHIQEGQHEQIVQTLFRLFHSLKGSAGYLNFENIKNLTHEAENLLDIFRKTKVKPSTEDVDLIYKAMDFLRQLLDNVASRLTDEGFEGEVDIIIKEIAQASTRHSEILQESLPTETSPGSPPAKEDTSSHEEIPPHSKIPTTEDSFLIEEEIPIVEEIAIEEEIIEKTPILSEKETLISPNEILSSEYLSPSPIPPSSEKKQKVSSEGISHSSSPSPSSSSASEETTLSSLIEEEVAALTEGFENEVSSTPFQEAKSEEVISLPEQEITTEVPASISSIPESPREKPDFSSFSLDNLVTPEMIERFQSETLELLDESEKNILDLEKTENQSELLQAIFRAIHSIKGNANFLSLERIAMQAETLENILDNLRNQIVPPSHAVTNLLLRGVDYIRQDLLRLGKKSTEETPPQEPYKPLGEILIEMGVANKEIIEEALHEKEKPLGEILVEKGVIDESTIQQALKKQASMTEQVGLGIQKREIRVDTSRLDRLFDLMGELINAEAMVFHHPLIKNIQDDNLQKAINHLTKISRELQEVTMEIRMVPLEGLFIRMHRLVRDLSRKFNKSIELRIIGQENEIDKNLIDQLADPLVHLLRNAIDHGIEKPQERINLGKPEKGLVEISAQYQGNEIWISIRDDGRGLDREKIIAKAREKNLLTKNPQEMSDNEIWKLIFLPGFSTKDDVTDISGRGVGMDVVMKNVEKLRGQIDVISQPNKGTTFTMKIPLTMAILDGIVCRVGKTIFILPLGEIVEFFKPRLSQVTRGEKDSLLIEVRGEILPIIDLEKVFYHHHNPTPLPERILVVVSTQEQKMAIAVDEIVSSQQVVVKSFSDFIGRIEGMIGCSILNQGQIGFIVDVKGLAKRLFE